LLQNIFGLDMKNSSLKRNRIEIENDKEKK